MGSESPLLFLMVLGGSLLGSWHCAGMCGPIVAALGQKSGSLTYHAGRGLSYVLAGGIAGAVGQAGLEAPPLFLRALAGLLLFALLVFSLFQSGDRPEHRAWARTIFRLMMKNRGSLFVAGFLSVLLPCGWLWTYLAAAAATGKPAAGALVLFALWLGSIPALAFIGGYLRTALPKAPLKSRRWAGVFLSSAGLYSLLSHFFFS